MTALQQHLEALRAETTAVLVEVEARTEHPPFRPEPLFPTRRSRTVLILSMLTAAAVGFLTGDWSWYR